MELSLVHLADGEVKPHGTRVRKTPPAGVVSFPELFQLQYDVFLFLRHLLSKVAHFW